MAYKERSNFVSGYLLDIINACEQAERDKLTKSGIVMMEELHDRNQGFDSNMNSLSYYIIM